MKFAAPTGAISNHQRQYLGRHFHKLKEMVSRDLHGLFFMYSTLRARGHIGVRIHSGPDTPEAEVTVGRIFKLFGSNISRRNESQIYKQIKAVYRGFGS